MSFLILLYFSFNFFLHFNNFLSIQIRDIIVLLLANESQQVKLTKKQRLHYCFQYIEIS